MAAWPPSSPAPLVLCLLAEIFLQVTSGKKSSTRPPTHHASQVISDFWSWRLRQSPEFATSLGHHQFNDKLELFSHETFVRRKEKCESFLRQITEIFDNGHSDLSESDLNNLWILRLDLTTYVSGYKWARLSMSNPLNFIEGLHRDASFWLDALPFDSETDVTNYLARLSAFSHQIDEHIHLMQQAVDSGWTNYESSMTSVVSHVASLMTSVPEAVLFVRPLNESLDNVPLPLYKREQIYDEAYSIIERQLLPRFEKLHRFLSERYLPATRQEASISSLPEGSDFYKACLHWYLTQEEDVRELLQLAYTHLDATLSRLDQIRIEQRFVGDLDAFFHHLRSSNTFFFHSERELVQRYKELVLHDVPIGSGSFFYHTRLNRLLIRPMLFDGPPAVMMTGSDDGSLPPVFFVNSRNLHKQPKWRMKSIVMKETIPGRYLQYAYTANQNLSSFRRWREYRKMYSVPFQFPFYTAFTEGWTLYAESLGSDVNVTASSPYDECGFLMSKLHKVVEMVLDINIHVNRWSRSRAIRFMADTLRLPAADVAADVDRVITFPAQAVAPVYGYVNIRDLRQLAESRLGLDFDLRLFHHYILKNGPVPIQFLYIEVSKWISMHARQKSSVSVAVSNRLNHSQSMPVLSSFLVLVYIIVHCVT